MIIADRRLADGSKTSIILTDEAFLASFLADCFALINRLSRFLLAPLRRLTIWFSPGCATGRGILPAKIRVEFTLWQETAIRVNYV